VDLSHLAERLHQTAPDLMDPAVEAAARDHAAFLTGLNASHDLLSRRVLIVLRDIPTDQHTGGLPWKRRRTLRQASAAVVVRRGEEAVRALTGLGITARLLDATEASAVLAESLSPGQPRLLAATDPITATTSTEDAR
jgi:hypothetical protein